MDNAREIVPDVAPLTSGKSPPASNSAIRSLPLVHVTIDDLLEESNKECLVCLEGHRIGSLAYKLACGHLFHTPCITKWLQKHCTCPVCRYELRTDDDNYERDRRKRMLQRKMRFRLDELQSKKVCQLREMASSFAVSIAGCIDKTEIIEKLLASGRIELVEAAPAMLIKEAVLKAMSVTELKCLLRQFGLADSGVLEKNELRERLLNSRRVVIDSLHEIQISEDRVETLEEINSEADSYGNAARNESHSWTCSLTRVGSEEVENREELHFKEKKESRDTCLMEKSANLTLYERTQEQSAGTASSTPEITGCISGYNGRSDSKQSTGEKGSSCYHLHSDNCRLQDELDQEIEPSLQRIYSFYLDEAASGNPTAFLLKVMEDLDEPVSRTDVECNKKRKKLFGDERLHRNRERNRMHARKTRERKKQQSNALQTRLNELENEGKKLRQIVDDRYTARVLLGLSQTYKNNLGENFDVQTSATICQNRNAPCSSKDSSNLNGCDETNISNDGGSNEDENYLNNADGTTMGSDQSTSTKRARRRGKYTPQEREKIRRERNRMHAKRTRDRKKKLLESSETQISRMERESHLLRGYCVSLNMLSAEEASKCEERTCESKRELAALKASQGEYDVDCDEDDDNDLNQNDEFGDGDDEHDNEGSLFGSDDNEKCSSWCGSNNENESLDSISGETSGDVSTSSSGKENNSGHVNNNSSSESNSLHSHSSSGSGSGSGSGGDSPTPKRPCIDRKAAKTFGFVTKPSKIFNVKQIYSHAYIPPHPIPEPSPRSSLTASSQSAESYNHGGAAPGNNTEATYDLPPLPTDIPVASTAALSVSQIKATLAAADHFKEDTNGTMVTTKSTRPFQASENYSLSISQQHAVPQVKKVKNILLSVIRAGISVPHSSGGISPQGAFTPVSTNCYSQVAPYRHPELSAHCSYAPLRVHRNFPSSNSHNACKPL